MLNFHVYIIIWHTYCKQHFNIIEMFNNKKKESVKTESHNRYYRCSRCGYITIVRDTECPVCIKDGLKIRMT